MTDLNAKCPACRRVYDKDNIEFKPVSAEEIARIKSKKKRRERERKEQDQQSKRHLANARIVQKNLVYVLGLPNKICNEDSLRTQEYFGQFGKIIRVMVNKRGHGHVPLLSQVPSNNTGVYITYARKEDATKAIEAIDGSVYDGKIIRATYGTTKYCTYYLKGQQCQNPGCSFLHEPGEEADLFAKEELSRMQIREKISKVAPFPAPSGPGISLSQAINHTLATSSASNSAPNTPTQLNTPVGSTLNVSGKNGSNAASIEESALPATASWAKVSVGSARVSTTNNTSPPASIAEVLAASTGGSGRKAHGATPSISSVNSSIIDYDHVVPDDNGRSRSSSRNNDDHNRSSSAGRNGINQSESLRSKSVTSNISDNMDELSLDIEGSIADDEIVEEIVALGSAALLEEATVDPISVQVSHSSVSSLHGFFSKSISHLNAPYYSYTGYFEGPQDSEDFMLKFSPLSLGFNLRPKYAGPFDPFMENIMGESNLQSDEAKSVRGIENKS